MDDTIRLEVIIIVNTKHEGGEVGNVKFEFIGLIEVGSIGNKDADMKVLGELNYVVASTVSLRPTLTLEYGGIRGIRNVCSMFAFGEEFGDSSTDAILELLTSVSERKGFNGHLG